MGKRYDNLTNGLFGWLEEHTDLEDWGCMSPRDGIISANTTARLEAALERRCWPQRLCKRLVQRHLNGSDTLYYRSRRGASVQVLMLDFDAHNGETDVVDLTLHVLGLLPGVYVEPSTHYTGLHGYLHVAPGSTPRVLFNRLVGLFAEALAAIAAENNYRAKVEVKGTCTTVMCQSGRLSIRTRGTLAKIPRLAGGERDLRALLASPVFTVADLRRVVDMAPPDLGLADAWVAAIHAWYGLPQLVPAHLQCKGSDKRGSHAPQCANVKYKGCVGEPDYGHRRGLAWAERVADNPDALARTREAGFVLARSLGRAPSAEELGIFYEQQGLHTGPAKSNTRARRMKAVAQFVEDGFDPGAGAGGYTEHAPALLEAVRLHVKPEHREGTCYRWRITDEDLVVALYVVTKGAFRGHPECGNGSIEKMFTALKGQGVIRRSCDRNKAVAMKTILERASLIVCIDEGYIVGVKGKAYGPGPNHPRYAEYQAELARPAEVVGTIALSAHGPSDKIQ